MLHIEKIFVRVGGKVLLFEIYQQDTVLSENKVGLSMRVQGPYLPPRKTKSLLDLQIRHFRIFNLAENMGKSYVAV